MAHHWQKLGGGLGKIRAEFGAVSDRADVDRRTLIFVLELEWKSFNVEVHINLWWIRLRFIVSCFSPVDWPTRTSNKKVHHAKNTPRQRDGMAAISSSRHQCLTVQQRCGSTKDVVQEFRIRNRVWTWRKKKAWKILLLLFSKVEADGAVLFDPSAWSVLLRCGSIRKRYDARFV